MFPYDAPDTNTRLTVELRDLVENGVKIWDFDYPSFYEGEEKTTFEQKVIDHYYFRQIGQETPARFLHMFRSRIREVMPYYIQLYESCRFMDFKNDDIFKSYDLTETFTEEHSDAGTTENTSEVTRENTVNGSDSLEGSKAFSDTPQGNTTNITNGYLTNLTEDNATNTRNETANGTDSLTGSGTTTNTGTIKHTLTRVGNIGVTPLGGELKANRDALINVDLQVINELNDLFLGLY